MTDVALRDRLEAAIRVVPDFPRPGIGFKDITPLLADRELLHGACAAMAHPFRALGITHVVAIESRGFLLGAPVAVALGAGLVPARKPRKLPYRTIRESYQLEYGADELELHEDALRAGDRIVVVDDVLATGGTSAAATRLARRLGATVVGSVFLIELAFLGGRAVLSDQRVESVLTYR